MQSRIRQFLHYEYKDPAAWLRTMRQIETLVVRTNLPYKARTLRTHSLRRWHEVRQAALFAYGMSQRMPDFRFDFAHVQHADYDAVVRWHELDVCHYTPVQLKEYVPPDLNASATLQEVIEGLSKYRDSADLVVAIYLNRRFRLTPGPIASLKNKLGGIYLVGAARPDQTRWHLIGDLLDKRGCLSTFAYPQ